ncbi:extracellular solute-binding protein [Streptomyces sp. NPDC002133]|uniref:extracellular solute-binding protein n=1 Tax=Streptomyces sp. NPDC002133 TaxID=3154409 RepID=UPI0033229613
MPRTARKARAAVAAAVAAVMLALGACAGGPVRQSALGEKQTLTVWGMGEEGQRLGELAEDFERRHPGITVEVTSVGWDVVHQKLISAAAAGTLPDMAQMGSTLMGEFIDLDLLEPADTGRFRQDDYFPAAWATNVQDGTVYGVPWYADVRVLYYRTDLARHAGSDAPPATWQEALDLARAYQREAGTDWGAAPQPGGTGAWQTWVPFLYSAGGDLLTDDGWPALDTPQSVRALTAYAKYFDEGLARRSYIPGYDVIKDFGSGRVPMFVSGPWQVQNIEARLPQLRGKWRAAPLPADETSTSYVGGSSLVTFSTSGHKAAAEAFTAFLTSPENQSKWYEMTKTLPANRHAWSLPALRGESDLDVFSAQLASARPVPPLLEWSEFADVIDEKLEKLARGADPETVAAEMQRSAEAVLG